MTAVFEKLALYFQYSFVQNALIVGVLIALCSSLLGVTLVLKRLSYIGDGLSHVAFGAVAIASVMNLSSYSSISHFRIMINAKRPQTICGRFVIISAHLRSYLF